MPVTQHVHIVGAGWAGLSAALYASQAGFQVTLHEASAQAGGRARGLNLAPSSPSLDNGQHILIGAYTATLALMRLVIPDADALLLRTPLDLRLPNGQGFQMRTASPSVGLLLGVFQAQGWRWRDKLALLKAALHWQIQGFTCADHWSVQDLCDHHALSHTVMAQLIEPLCLSALNTPVDSASAAVFLRVLKDAFTSGHGGCDLLIPRVNLSELWVNACLEHLQIKQCQLAFKHRVNNQDIAQWLHTPNTHVVLACPAWQAAALTQDFNPAWAQQTQQLQHQGIATVYLQCHDAHFKGLDRPMMALAYSAQQPAQFVFDHGQTTNQTGLLAAVVSACQRDTEQLTHLVMAQLQQQLGLQHLSSVKTLVEKRATFSCTPQLARPPMQIAAKLWACGDYVQGPYPATLEGAVRSGHEVIQTILSDHLIK